MRVLFVCWRPYQLFNAINIVSNNVENTYGNSDLFISDLPSLLAVKDKIRDTKLFNNIGVYDDLYGDDIVSRLERIFAIPITILSRFTVRHFIKEGNFPDLKYDLLFGSGYSHFFTRMVNANPDARVIFLEDGIGHYLNYEKRIYSKLKSERFLYRFFRKGVLSINPEKRYVYRPDMVNKTTNDVFCKMPDLNNAYGNLKTVFGTDIDILPENKKFLYLYEDSWFKFTEKENPHIDENKLNRVLELFADKMLTRLHPAMKDGPENLPVDERKYMWEISARNLTADDTLISILSTACLTPFFLYGVTPRIIFLFQLNEKSFNKTDEMNLRFVERFRRVYPGKVFIPTSYEELETVLKSCI